MSRLRVVTAAGDMENETVLAEALTYRSDVDLVLRCVDRVELLASIRGANLDAIVLVGSVEWFDRQIAHEASVHSVVIVSVSDRPDPRLHATALHADASLEAIVEACRGQSAEGRTIEPRSLGRGGRITTVWGPKGAPGRTRVAIELAFILEGTGADPLLLDADPYGGSVVQSLGIAEEIPNIVWASSMASKDALDEGEVAANLRRAHRGPVVIPGLPRADLWADVSEFGFAELLSSCRRLFGHTVVDAGFCLEPATSAFSEGGEGRNRMARRSIREADRVVAVCHADPIGLKNFLWAFDELGSLIDVEKVAVVVNRVEPGSEREVARLLARHIGKRPVAYFPDDPHVMRSALAHGTAASTLKGGSELRAAAEALAISAGARLKARGVLTRLGARQ